MTIELSHYLERIDVLFPSLKDVAPWDIVQQAGRIIREKISTLGPDYKIFNEVAIHKTVTIDSHVQLKGPAIISQNCFIGAHSLVRGGVLLDEGVSIGPGCEVKTTFIFSNTSLAHFNFVGDSLLGSRVNMEAGAVIANHYNEREDKTITLCIDGENYITGLRKFGAIVGDHTKIGANAVLSPGTVLKTRSIVGRLELVEQCPSPGR